MGLKRAGIGKIVGVDINPQPEYPFEFIKSDIFNLDEDFLKEFDFIWASPPCQKYTFATRKWRNLGKEYPDLVGKTRALLLRVGRPFVIENVYTAPIRRDLMLCGVMFGLSVIKHRWFELHGFEARQPYHIRHQGTVRGGEYVTVAGHGGDGKASLIVWQKAMGIDWITDKKMLAEAIPPVYSEYIAREFSRKEVNHLFRQKMLSE